MMLLFRRIWMMIALSGIILSTNVYAAGSGAFRVETPDAAAMGKGSAFVGEANTPAAIYYNPAGLTQIVSSSVSVGTALIMPAVDFHPSSGNEVQMRRNKFLVPHVYAAIPIISKSITIGIGATSFYGLGTEFASDAGGNSSLPIRYIATESVIENKDYLITAAFKVNDKLSFAVSADNDDSKASRKKNLLQGGVGDDGSFQLKAKDSAWGFRVATMYEINEQHQIGLMYRSKISHDYEGKAYLEGLNNAGTPFNTIFGGSSYETKFTEKFTLPQSVVIGYSYKPNTKWTFNFDLEWMDWSSVKNEALNWTDESNSTRLSVLNTGNPASRDWKSVISEAFGVEYAASDRLRLRGGYYHHLSPIPQDTWDPSIPDSNSHGFTAGLGFDITKKLTLDLAYSALVFEDRKVDNAVGNSSGGSVDGKYQQIINMGLVTLTYNF